MFFLGRSNGARVIEKTHNLLFPWSVRMNFDVVDWTPIDNWCVEHFGNEGVLWSIGWENGTWDFQKFEDAMMMWLTWVR